MGRRRPPAITRSLHVRHLRHPARPTAGPAGRACSARHRHLRPDPRRRAPGRAARDAAGAGHGDQDPARARRLCAGAGQIHRPAGRDRRAQLRGSAAARADPQHAGHPRPLARARAADDGPRVRQAGAPGSRAAEWHRGRGDLLQELGQGDGGRPVRRQRGRGGCRPERCRAAAVRHQAARRARAAGGCGRHDRARPVGLPARHRGRGQALDPAGRRRAVGRVVFGPVVAVAQPRQPAATVRPGRPGCGAGRHDAARRGRRVRQGARRWPGRRPRAHLRRLARPHRVRHRADPGHEAAGRPQGRRLTAAHAGQPDRRRDTRRAGRHHPAGSERVGRDRRQRGQGLR